MNNVVIINRKIKGFPYSVYDWLSSGRRQAVTWTNAGILLI